MMPLSFFLLLSVGTLTTAQNSNAVVTSSDFRKIAGDSITKYDLLARGVNAVGCARESAKYPILELFAYDDRDQVCYLGVDTGSSGGVTINGVVIYQNEAPECKVEEAPINYTTTSVSWLRTLTSRTGNLTCDDEHVYSGDSATIHCSTATNWAWYSDGECKRKIYRNPVPDHEYPLPKTITPGWSMCIQGATGASVYVYGFQLRPSPPVSSILYVQLDQGWHVTRGVVFDSMSSTLGWLQVQKNENNNLWRINTNTNITYNALALNHIQVTFETVGLSPEVVDYTLHPSMSLDMATHFSCFILSSDYVMYEINLWC